MPLNAQDLLITPMAPLPMPISNNAVVEGWKNGVAQVYSFGGIDSTKLFSGITLSSFRYDTQNDSWDTIAPLPDTRGKIAVAASNVQNKIYITGGYYVFANGNEISSDKVHIYDPETNAYLPDGASIPLAIDDHVQVVWRDSLIYLITGWSNTNNRNVVQIYNPALDEWYAGTSVPNTNAYKAFGASGMIRGDSIFYFGGAKSGNNFPVSNNLRIGIIDTLDPTQITWMDTVIAAPLVGYRMAATLIEHDLYWIGGSDETYNYDGIAYAGGGVEPNNRVLSVDPVTFSYGIDTSSVQAIPMDLRGIARVNAHVFYLAGGMEANQKVSNKCLRIRYENLFSIKEHRPILTGGVYPNPVNNALMLGKDFSGQVQLFSEKGEKVMECYLAKGEPMQLGGLAAGLYLLHTKDGQSRIVKR